MLCFADCIRAALSACIALAIVLAVLGLIF